MSDLTKRLRDGSEPLSYKRDAEAADTIEQLTAREAELVAVLMTESEKCDLLSKEHYRDEIARLTAENKDMEWVLINSGFVRCDIMVARIEKLEGDNHEWYLQAKEIERLSAENERLTMMLTEYVRLNNAGKIPLEPIGGADKETGQ